MKSSSIVIITGLPCTGKTTLGRRIAQEYRLPFFSRDALKESLFDSLGHDDREWSKKLGRAGYDLLYLLIEEMVGSGTDFIVESNFDPHFAEPVFRRLQEDHGVRVFQIFCTIDKEMHFELFKKRAESDERHVGHQDHLVTREGFEEFLVGAGSKELDLNGEVFAFHAVGADSLGYTTLTSELHQFLSG